MPAAHRETHRALLQEFRRGRQRRIDAILVPAGRSVQHLEPAATLASRLGCPLIALCSPRGARPDEIRERATRWPGFRGYTIDLPAGYDHPLLRLGSTRNYEQTAGRLGLLSAKRNVGLILGRLLGWRAVFFLDDDIDDLDPFVIAEAASGLDHSAAVGLRIPDLPDNSVVCHANRLGRGDQDVFVSGSALLVNCHRPVGFFPNIYNEDWLFLFDEIAANRVARHEAVHQLSYDPFSESDRAGQEEFGEVIAEGLVDGLHEEVPLHAFRRTDYWRAFLDKRYAFIARAEQRVRDNAPEDQRDAALASLAAAALSWQEIDAEWCVDWISTWRADGPTWRRRMDELPRLWTFEEAARFLGLRASSITTPATAERPAPAAT